MIFINLPFSVIDKNNLAVLYYNERGGEAISFVL